MDQYSIEIESKGSYNAGKRFKLRARMSVRDFVALQVVLLDFFDRIDNDAMLETTDEEQSV